MDNLPEKKCNGPLAATGTKLFKQDPPTANTQQEREEFFRPIACLHLQLKNLSTRPTTVPMVRLHVSKIVHFSTFSYVPRLSNHDHWMFIRCLSATKGSSFFSKLQHRAYNQLNLVNTTRHEPLIPNSHHFQISLLTTYILISIETTNYMTERA